MRFFMTCDSIKTSKHRSPNYKFGWKIKSKKTLRNMRIQWETKMYLYNFFFLTFHKIYDADCACHVAHTKYVSAFNFKIINHLFSRQKTKHLEEKSFWKITLNHFWKNINGCICIHSVSYINILHIQCCLIFHFLKFLIHHMFINYAFDMRVWVICAGLYSVHVSAYSEKYVKCVTFQNMRS